jgi:hypothetical protein
LELLDIDSSSGDVPSSFTSFKSSSCFFATLSREDFREVHAEESVVPEPCRDPCSSKVDPLSSLTTRSLPLLEEGEGGRDLWTTKKNITRAEKRRINMTANVLLCLLIHPRIPDFDVSGGTISG